MSQYSPNVFLQGLYTNKHEADQLELYFVWYYIVLAMRNNLQWSI